ncbi:MAG: GNAT family N-acetyltransferase [Nocardioides sp.]|nr:GNAT family N-acetyltransferase [Nocardioides sp.]
MNYTIEPTNQRAWTDEQMESLFAEGFPAFITADPEVKKYIARVREYFPQLDVILVSEDGQPAATGWGVPILWADDVADLPHSFADILRVAVEAHESGADTNAFVICGGVVHPELKRTGTATELVRALIQTGQDHGMTRVLAPLRPTRKHLYPLISIEEYASWVRDDGLRFDPWLRLHVLAGGRVIALAPNAQTMTGSVQEWEEWARMPLPATGQYVIPDGMSVLHIDKDADVGTYTEPNIWIQHL